MPREFGLADLNVTRARVVYNDDDLPLGQFKLWRFPGTFVIIAADTDELLTDNKRTRAIVFDLEPDSSLGRQGDAGRAAPPFKLEAVVCVKCGSHMRPQE